MRSLELITLGVDGRLSERLAAWSLDRGWWHRPLQHATAFTNLLRKGSRGVFLLKLGREMAAELTLLRDTARDFGELTTIVIGDDDLPVLEAVAYDLGATAVLFPPQGVEVLFEMLERCGR